MTKGRRSPLRSTPRALRGAGEPRPGERDVAAHVTDPHDGAVRGEALDLGLELLAEGVLGDEGDEGHRVVHGLGTGRGGRAVAGARRVASLGGAPRGRPPPSSRRRSPSRPGPWRASRRGSRPCCAGRARASCGRRSSRPPAPGSRRAAGPRRTATGARRGTPGRSRSTARSRPTFSAMRSRKASPRPIAPAGGCTNSPLSSAPSKRASSEGSMRWANVASTTTVTSASGNSLAQLVDGALELREARRRAPLGRDVGTVDDDVPGCHVQVSQAPRGHAAGASADGRALARPEQGPVRRLGRRRLASSSSWMACEPVAGLPDGAPADVAELVAVAEQPVQPLVDERPTRPCSPARPAARRAPSRSGSGRARRRAAARARDRAARRGRPR